MWMVVCDGSWKVMGERNSEPVKCNINATGGEHFMFLTVFSVSTPGFCLETKLSVLGKFCTKCVLCYILC